MEYSCHIWAGAPNCYLDLLDKLQKQICRTVGPSLAVSLEPLAHCWNVASLKENFSLIIFSLFHLNWPRIGFYNPIYKNYFFFFQNIFLHHLHKLCMAFYLLTWTYFSDINGGRPILINSQLKRILFISSDQKKWSKTEKDRKTWKMKVKLMKVT